MKEIHQLNRQFSWQDSHGSLVIKSAKGGLPVIDIQNELASAQICLQGAQVLKWQPKGQPDVLWLSEDADFSPGQSIRGGIPVCWPWFGAHPSNPAYPAHGIARISNWQLQSTETLKNGATRVSLSLPAHTANMWLADTTLELTLTIGSILSLALTTRNHGNQPIVITQALHSYFKVGDVRRVLLHGLDDAVYLDKLDHFSRKHQRGALTISSEVDRIFLDSINDCIIEDNALNRKLILHKGGSHSTVVWNPWRETALKMGDLGEQGYLNMLCVESANVADDKVTIDPGKQHRLWVEYKVEPFPKC